MFTGKNALLLDMNNTFMFGEDRFGKSEDFSIHYHNIGGTLTGIKINALIRAVYEYLDIRYADEKYLHSFPSVEYAVREVSEINLDRDEMDRIVNTFAFHELGYIPRSHIEALRTLKQYMTLTAVIDIWSPKTAWLDSFENAGIASLFSAISFSSDHGMIKPSPKPFERVLRQIGVSNNHAVVVGDSPTRDLGGARNAGIECVLVGKSKDPDAVMNCDSLLELCESLRMIKTLSLTKKDPASMDSNGNE